MQQELNKKNGIKQSSAFNQNKQDSENTNLKKFDKFQNKVPEGSNNSQSGQGIVGTGGLILTTCLKLAMNNEPRLTIGCDILTDFFRGGFVSKKIYEIFGESGSGKT